MSFYGAHAEEKLKFYNFNTVVLGVDGIDIGTGVSTHFEPEASFNRAMCAAAERIIVVTDSSKFGTRSLHSVLPLSDIDTLVTDKGIPENFQDELNSLGVELLIIDVE